AAGPARGGTEAGGAAGPRRRWRGRHTARPRAAAGARRPTRGRTCGEGTVMRTTTVAEGVAAAGPGPGDSAIRLDGLTKTYPGAAAPAVTGLDLDIPRGELV